MPTMPIPTRRIRFEERLAELPRYPAAGDDLVLSHLLAVLSSVFPDGEDFFVASVRHFRDDLTDPALRRQVAGFIGQEATHGREHRALNARLAELGYPTRRIERMVRTSLGLRQRFLPPISNLATTAALEHFTATLAEVLLEDEDARAAFGSPDVLDLFLWHAIEECEHKAVAFDVYRAVGGSERLRTVTMNVTTAFFFGVVGLHLLSSLLGDRETYRRGRLAASLRNLRQSPFLCRDVWSRLRDYNRADFHPDDRDTRDLLAAWRDELFGADGRLRPLLATAVEADDRGAVLAS